jgi:hypothetical protein
MNKLRETTERPEIHIFFQNLLDKKEMITIWQVIGGERRIYEALLKQIQDNKIIFELSSLSKNPGEIPTSKKAIYVHGDYQDFLFKRDNFSLSNNLLTTTIPPILKLIERRKHKRHQFKYQNQHSIDFMPKGDLKRDELERSTTNTTLIDLSTEGCSFVVSATDVVRFPMGESFVITRIGGKDLDLDENAVVMQTVYYELYEEDKVNERKLFRVGGKFESPMPSISLTNYRNDLAVTNKLKEKYNISSFCGYSFEEQEKIVHDIFLRDEEMGSILKSNLESLQKLVYMTPTMKKEFLSFFPVSDLASSMRMCQEETVLKFLDGLTESLIEDFLHVLNEPKPVKMILKAQEEICEEINARLRTGALVLDERSFNKEV